MINLDYSNRGYFKPILTIYLLKAYQLNFKSQEKEFILDFLEKKFNYLGRLGFVTTES